MQHWNRDNHKCRLCKENDLSPTNAVARLLYGYCDQCYDNPKGDSLAKKIENKEIIHKPEGIAWVRPVKPLDKSLIETE